MKAKTANSRTKPQFGTEPDPVLPRRLEPTLLKPSLANSLITVAEGLEYFAEVLDGTLVGGWASPPSEPSTSVEVLGRKAVGWLTALAREIDEGLGPLATEEGQS